MAVDNLLKTTSTLPIQNHDSLKIVMNETKKKCNNPIFFMFAEVFIYNRKNICTFVIHYKQITMGIL